MSHVSKKILVSAITSKKARENDVDFSTSEITSKKYVKMTWKFLEIWKLTYQRNVDVESTPIPQGVALGLLHCNRIINF